MGTIVDGVAKAKKMEPKLPNWLIEGIEKMQRLSSFSHAWTHVVQYRAQSLLPYPFLSQITKQWGINHKSTDEATIISFFADSASPSSSSS